MRTKHHVIAGVLTGLSLVTCPQAASAFDRGCAEHTLACYEKVRRPDVYATVERPVVVAPARREVQHVPAVIQERPYRVEVAPQRVREIREPAIYDTVRRHQLVQPARVSYVEQPAVIERVYETVVTHPGGVAWQRSVGRDGVERMCAVRVAPRTATVARDVVVAPARRVAVSTPAVYREVETPVLVRPAHVRHEVEPAQYAVAHRRVVLRPASTVIVDHPPVIGVTRQAVLVRSGGTAWQRADDHRW